MSTSRAEQITSEVKRLVLRCRQLEADIAKSVPKKQMDDAIASMQQKIDGLNSELEDTQRNLEAAIAMNERMKTFERQMTQQNEQISSQNEMIKSISTRIDTMVPNTVYDQATARVRELEQMVDSKSKEFAALQSMKEGLESRISQMVPQEQFASIKAELAGMIPIAKHEEELQRVRSETVPRDEYSRMELRVADLESQLSNSVPKSEFEELSQTIVSLTKTAPVVEEEQFAVPQVTIKNAA